MHRKLHFHLQLSFSFQVRLTEEQKSSLRKFQAADERLYEHFRAKLDAEIEAFGTERMAAEVRELERLNEALKRLCVKGVKDNNRTFDLFETK